MATGAPPVLRRQHASGVVVNCLARLDDSSAACRLPLPGRRDQAALLFLSAFRILNSALPLGFGCYGHGASRRQAAHGSATAAAGNTFGSRVDERQRCPRRACFPLGGEATCLFPQVCGRN